MDTLISVIAIFHNQEQYVSRCLDSLINQSYRNVEIVCIDDCSTDNTPLIIRDYCKSNRRICCKTTDTNVTENVARKLGFYKSHGDYVLFIDGDDTLELDACEFLRNEIQKNPVDILHFGTNLRIEEHVDNIIDLDGIKRSLQPYSGSLFNESIFSKCFLSGDYNHNIFDKFYNADLLRNAFQSIESIPLRFAADKYQYFVISSLAHSYRGVSKQLYNYSYGIGISTSKSMDIDTYDTICSGIEAAHASYRYAIEKNNARLIKAASLFGDQMLMNVFLKGISIFEDQFGEALSVLLRYYEPAKVVAALAEIGICDWKGFAADISKVNLISTKTNKIKTIAMFYYRLYDGGTERVMANLAEQFNQMGYHVILFTDKAASENDYYVSQSIERIILPESKDSMNNYLDRGMAIQQAIKEYNIDLMIYHAWSNPILIWDLLTCKWNGVSYTIYCHGVFSVLEIRDTYLLGILPYAYSLADGVITLTKVDSEFWGCFNNNVFQTYNPMQFSSVNDIPCSLHNGNTIIWCQRFAEEKNPEDVIEIFKLVYDRIPSARLMMVGKGENTSYEYRVKNLVKNLGLSDKVTFCGYKKNVEQYYHQSDVCIITSDHECFPMGLIESMAAGVPVVMYELPYLTMTEKGNGILSVKGKNKKEMAERIIDLLMNVEKRKHMGEQARISIREMLEYDYPGEWVRFLGEIENADNQVKTIPIMWDTLFSHCRLSEKSGATDELSEIRKSFSFRLGHALTTVPRWIRHKLTGFPM